MMLAGHLPPRPRVISPRWQLERASASAPLRRRLEPWFRPLALVFRQPPTRPTPVVLRAGDQVNVTIAPRFELTVRLFDQLRLLVDRSTPIIGLPGATGRAAIPVGAPPAWPGGPVIGRSDTRPRPDNRPPAAPPWPGRPVIGRSDTRPRRDDRPPAAPPWPGSPVIGRSDTRPRRDDRSLAASLWPGEPSIGSDTRPRPDDRAFAACLLASSEGRVIRLPSPTEGAGRAGLVPAAGRLTLGHQPTARAIRAGAPTPHRAESLGERRIERGGRVPIRTAERQPDRGTLHQRQLVDRRRPVSVGLPSPTAFRVAMPPSDPWRAHARMAPPGGPVGAGLPAGSVAIPRSTAAVRRRGLGPVGPWHRHRDLPAATVRLSSDPELGDDQWTGRPARRWHRGAGRPVDPVARLAGHAPAGHAIVPTGPLTAVRALEPTGVPHRAVPDADPSWTTDVNQPGGPGPGRLGRGKQGLGRSLRHRLSAAEPRRGIHVSALAESPPIQDPDRRPVGDVDLVARSGGHTGRSSIRPTAPVDQVFRRSVDPGRTRPATSVPPQPPSPAPQPIDIDRLDRDLWERFEKRIQVERQRRGRA
jgi:hypothetical protein